MYDPALLQLRPQPWFGFARTKELRGSSQPQVRGQKSRARNPMSSLSWQYRATSLQLGAIHKPDAASQNGVDGGQLPPQASLDTASPTAPRICRSSSNCMSSVSSQPGFHVTTASATLRCCCCATLHDPPAATGSRVFVAMQQAGAAGLLPTDFLDNPRPTGSNHDNTSRSPPRRRR